MSDQGNFLTDIIEADLKAGKNGGKVVTRFPPEPNGYLHIGHSKSILLNFGLARRYGGRAHMRFDDTNPTTEDTEYVEAIMEDARWLGADWGTHLYFASDYFQKMYDCAERLIKEGKAFVDSQPVEKIREQRGSFERPGVNSPFRGRSPDENLALFRRMKAGELADGEAVLRAKIDMAHPNVIMRDPLLYRIRHAHHHRTGDTWCIYPMYDYAHPLEDAFEGVTHSICTLEFESNRELYDWTLDNLGPWDPRPRQYEFARLALGYTVMSKRKLLQLVTEKRVDGWDNPRMPTVAGMRRRGVTAEALRDFNELIGVAKNNSLVDIGKLEFALRADLEKRRARALAVLSPLKLVLTDWNAGKDIDLEIPWWPGEPGRGVRKVPFGRELLIERDDFSADPPKDWKRLAPGREVRLIGGYVVHCAEVVRAQDGSVTELRCTHDPKSLAGGDKKGLGAINWVHATRSAAAAVRLYDRLFTVEQPDLAGDFLTVLNPEALVVPAGARVEPALAKAEPGARYQFMRQGYFFVDPKLSQPGAPVFNRTIALKDTWGAKAAPETRQKRAPKPKDAGAPKSADARAERRAKSPELAAAFARYQGELGLSAEEAEVLTAAPELAAYFDAAVRAHARSKSVARWLVNDLLGLAGDASFATLPLVPTAFGRFVALVDGGRVTTAAAKTLLASLFERPGEPEPRMRELGLEKVDDSAALDAAIARALAAQAAEVARYKAGEKKLFGVLLGAVMRETKGAADAALVRQRLTEAIG